MIESRRPESGLLLIFTLLFVFTIACGSDDSDGDNLSSGGDVDLEEQDLEPAFESDQEAGDGDYEEREFEKFVWEDDTYGQ